MSNTPHPGPDLPENAGSDPSMDDILASIRRILSEEDEQHAAIAADDDDVLDLDTSMLLTAEAPAPPALADILAQLEPELADIPAPPPPPLAASYVAALPPPLPPAEEVPIMTQPSSLLSTATATLATQAMSQLVSSLHTDRQTAVYRGGPTLEDLVRDEMRPLLASWLDTHLPEMVERVVRSEIERLAGRAMV